MPNQKPHVFISYIYQNSPEVQRLCDELTAHGVAVWLDRNNIGPGMRWKRAIRRAIRQGFFIACFSKEYNARRQTFMNEELALAIEELRQHPTDRIWFIPVLLSESDWPVAVVDLEGFKGSLTAVYDEAWRGWKAVLEIRFPNLSLPDWSHELAARDPAAQAQAFRRAICDLLDRLFDQPDRPGLLLFLDEMDTLFDQPEYLNFAALLRSIAEDPRYRGRFALLLAGLEPTLNRSDRLAGGRNPFYSFLGEVPVGPLEFEDARKMVASIGGQMGVSYTEDALKILVTAGGGHPFLTRQLCSQTIRDLERPAAVDVEQARQAIEAYLRQS